LFRTNFCHKIAAEIQGEAPNAEVPMGAEIEANDSSALAEIDFDDGMLGCRALKVFF
jgi:hypothetical protein